MSATHRANETIIWLNSLKLYDIVDFLSYQWGMGRIIKLVKDVNGNTTSVDIETNDSYWNRKTIYINHDDIESDNDPQILNVFDDDSDSEDNKRREKDFQILHPEIRKLHTMTPYHNDEDFGYCCRPQQTSKCTICQRLCCDKCFGVVIFSSSKGCDYQCKDCFIINEYEYIFTLIKYIYDEIYNHKNNLLELNIIAIITNYGMNYDIKCHKQIYSCNTTINLEKQINGKLMDFKSNHIDGNDIVLDKSRKILCYVHGRLKRRQHNDAKCVIYHDYDGKETIHCHDCNSILCNKCLKLNAFEQCSKCKNAVCEKCKDDAKECPECNVSFGCASCFKIHGMEEIFKKCDECGYIVCGGCAPCYCKFQNINKLIMDEQEEQESESDIDSPNTQNNEMIEVD